MLCYKTGPRVKAPTRESSNFRDQPLPAHAEYAQSSVG